MLIVNLGTPEATDYWSMRRYLAEFLSDRRVIEAPLSAEQAAAVSRLLEALEDHEDVKEVYSNGDFPDEATGS